jgi:hypothetical protein
VASTSPAFTTPNKPHIDSQLPQDDGEHDPDIDLITLRRKSKPTLGTCKARPHYVSNI